VATPAIPAPQVSDVPQTYRVVDGDDLTSIATRFYGHPGAAAMIWDANRAAISDPSLLPIGAELRLPASWAAGGSLGPALAGRAIEPPPTTSADVAAGPRTAPVSWLGAGGPSAGVAPGRPAVPPRSVRVAPGETLATLAARFYGDASQANRIWEVNRDQLRSPELVVAGMELRLP
jgi:nucleoid-associated protein YgaU